MYSVYIQNICLILRRLFKTQVWDMVDCISTEVLRNILPEVCCSKGKPGKDNVTASLD